MSVPKLSTSFALLIRRETKCVRSTAEGKCDFEIDHATNEQLQSCMYGMSMEPTDFVQLLLGLQTIAASELQGDLLLHLLPLTYQAHPWESPFVHWLNLTIIARPTSYKIMARTGASRPLAADPDLKS